MDDDTPGDEDAQAEAESGAQAESQPSAEELFESYVFPDTRQRRITGFGLAGLGAICIIVWAVWARSADWVNAGLLVGGIVLIAIAAYFFAAAFAMRLDQGEALVLATKEIGFAVGHASAVLGWRGWRARPTWRILLYSAEDPPAQRGLVELDALSGDVLGSYSEDNPEDWDAIRKEEDERPS